MQSKTNGIWSWLLCCMALMLTHCAMGEVEQTEGVTSTVECMVREIDYPVAITQFQQLYRNRDFYRDGNHLGRDIQLAEGTPIKAIGCGTIRIFRPANGYGSLAVVIEHRLAQPITVKNGEGRMVTITNFLSIYGHLRHSSARRGGTVLNWRSGETVGMGDVIGYIQNDAENGDGAEHLHFGIRLQSMSDSQRTDPTAWFRGYDATTSQKRWFADPALFLNAAMSQLTARDEEPFLEMDAAILPATDASVTNAFDQMTPPTSCVPQREDCNGRDDDCDGQIDEDQGELSCGRGACHNTVPACVAGAWNICRERPRQTEVCGDGVDQDCDGVDPACPIPSTVTPVMDAGTTSTITDAGQVNSAIRYEFRVRPGYGWEAEEPFSLRDQNWSRQRCQNTGTYQLERTTDGFMRCDLATRLSPFIGSFYDPTHPFWGDMGQIGTVGNAPERCTATQGVEWRITDLRSGMIVYDGSSSGLPCASIGTQDRHRLP